MYMVINEETISEAFLYPIYNIAEACIEKDVNSGFIDVMPNLMAFVEAADSTLMNSNANATVDIVNNIVDEAGKRANSQNFIQRKIASLRKLYAKWLAKANKETDSGKANLFKRVAVKIMNAIDKLLAKLSGEARAAAAAKMIEPFKQSMGTGSDNLPKGGQPGGTTDKKGYIFGSRLANRASNMYNKATNKFSGVFSRFKK